jgi:PAS domain S-box-containing protein
LLERTFQDITHPEDLSIVQRRRCSPKGRDISRGEALFSQGGLSVWVRVSVSLVRDATGEPRFFTSQIRTLRAARM